MSKELKFRAWSVTDNRYSKPFGLDFSVLNYTDDDGLDVIKSKSLSNEVVQQFTGIKDRKGNDIYEGDIVKGIDASNENFTCIVNNVYGSFRIGEHNEALLYNLSHKLDVVGNVYENKDLITTE